MKLQQARDYALSLPEATEEPHFDLTSFRVRGKIFATSPPGESYLHIFVDEDLRAPLIAAHPDAYEPLRWGAKVVGIRVTLVSASDDTVKTLLLASWKRKAPKRLAVAFSTG
jgi:hypothetical protein